MSEGIIDPDQPQNDGGLIDPDAPAPAAPVRNFREHQRDFRKAITQGDPNLPAEDVVPGPDLSGERLTGAQIGKQWGDVAKGVPKGFIAGTIGTGLAGDAEEYFRHLTKEFGVNQKTAIPTTTEGGWLGPRGVGVMDAAATPQEAAGMTIGTMLIPGLKKLPGAFRRGAPEVPPGGPSGVPFELHPEAPQSVVRPDTGARLLPPDVPHTLPPNTETVVPRGLGRTSAGAEAVRSIVEDASPDTLNVLRSQLEQSGLTPWTLEQRIEEMSPHHMLFEVDPNMTGEMQKLSKYTGESKNSIVGSLKGRALEAQDRMRGAFNDAFGEPQNLSVKRRELSAEQKRISGPFWNAFTRMEVPPSEALDALTPRLRAAGALAGAKRAAAIQGKSWTNAFDVMEEGKKATKQVPTPASYQLIKEALDQQIENSFNTRGEATKRTRDLTELKNDMIDAIDNHPDSRIGAVWKAARDTWAGPAQLKGAHQLGKRILTESIDKDELPFMLSRYSNADRQALAEGIRADLENKLGRPGPQNRRVMNQVLSENNKAKIREVLQDDAKAQRLFDAIEHEHSMHDMPTLVHGGAQTANRLGGTDVFAPQPTGLETTANVAGTGVGLIMEPKRAFGEAGTFAANKFAKSQKARAEAAAQKLRNEMATLYTLQGPERDAVLRWILGSEKGFAFGGAVKKKADGGPVLSRDDGGAALPDDPAPIDESAEVQAAAEAAAARMRAGYHTPHEEPRLLTFPGKLAGALGENIVNDARRAATYLPASTEAFIQENYPGRVGESYPDHTTEQSTDAPTSADIAGGGIGTIAGTQLGGYRGKLLDLPAKEIAESTLPRVVTHPQPTFSANAADVETAKSAARNEAARQVSDIGFYSHGAEAAQSLPQEVGTPQQFRAMLEKQGVKKEEFDNAHWDSAFAEKPKVTKQEVATLFNDSMKPVQERWHTTNLGEDEVRDAARQWVEENHPEYRVGGATFEDAVHDKAQEMHRDILRYGPQSGHEAYNTLGGTNHRELLLTLPVNGPTQEDVNLRLAFREARVIQADTFKEYKDTTELFGQNDPRTEQALANWKEAAKKTGDLERQVNAIPEGQAPFKSKHWDEPNPLVHVRLQDQVIDGKKTLLVDELQSDWHQLGRKQGYKQPMPVDERPAAINKLHALEQQLDSLHSKRDTSEYAALAVQIGELRQKIIGEGGVPDAPFKTSWPDLAMKRVMKYAADNGYDQVAWTHGATQADRYDLSRQISRIEYNPKTGDLTAYDIGGSPAIVKGHVTPEKLPEQIGKEAAERVLNKPTEKASQGPYGQIHILSGVDLKVGGEGMKGFYDKILPAKVNALVKKHGVKVEQSNLDTGKNEGFMSGHEAMKALSKEDADRLGVPSGEENRTKFWREIDSDKRDEIFDAARASKSVPVHVVPINYSLEKELRGGVRMFSNAADKDSVARNEAMRAVTRTPEFKNWFGDSTVVDKKGEPLVVYHGGTNHGAYEGSGMPHTMDRRGKDFSEFSNEDAPYRGGILSFFTTSPKFANDYAGKGVGANVKPVYLKIEKPFDYRKDWRMAEDFYEETGGIRDDIEANRILMGLGKLPEHQDVFSGPGASALSQDDFVKSVKSGSWDALEAPDFVEWLREGGHDGIVTKENNAINYAVFEPTQVKSATGNRGTFDPNDPNILHANAADKDSLARNEAIRAATQTPEFKKWFGDSAVVAADPAKNSLGLSFPKEEAADRLRMNLARDERVANGGKEAGLPVNERRVIRAPAGSGLPDFVTGRITPEDWVARTEKMLSPEEIESAAKWYDRVFDMFLQHAHGDEDKARRYMRGWLVAQQNADVSSSMQNMLLQAEQVARGVPEKKMIAGGMPNPTLASRRVMQGRDIEEGVGHKIADFVDSAEGKDVRAWMGNDPRGRSPFVVDIHTARDMGLVDSVLSRHLGRLGYNKNDLKGLKNDFDAGINDVKYENRVKFGHELTDHLNEIGWMGRNDWKPREVQAVGWMAMTKLTADKAEDVLTGLASQMRHLSMELSPGEGSPWANKYGKRFSELHPQQQYALTHDITQQAIKSASKIAGVDVRDIVHGTGGWQNFQNPSTVAQTFSSKQGAEVAANVLGHLLQQTEVWANKVKPVTANPKGFAVDIFASGDHKIGTDEGLRNLWGKIMEADPTGTSKAPLFQGYQPIVSRDGLKGIRVLIDRGGEKTKDTLEKAVSGPIGDMLKSLPGDFETRLHEAEITKARNDWTKQKNGQGYTSRLVDLLGRNPAADLRSHGQELEEAFRRGLQAAEDRAKRAAESKPEITGSSSTIDRKAAAPERAIGGVVIPFARASGGRVVAGNIHHNPSEAQKEAGNYAKDHIHIHGLPITVENAKGSVRRGVDRDGKSWSSVLPDHYGYVKKTEGADGDHVDVYIGPHPKSPLVFVIDQIDAQTGKWDEHKVMLGFGNENQAKQHYIRGFSDGKGAHRIGRVHAMTVERFKAWLKDGDTKRPFAHMIPESEKRDHSTVGYVAESKIRGRSCANCAHYIPGTPPACEGVKKPIAPVGWCRRWKRGK